MPPSDQDDLLAALQGSPIVTPHLREGERALLVYADILTLTPQAVARSHIDALREVGYDDRAIHDACAIVGYFSFVNRIADGLGVELEGQNKEAYAQSAGYGVRICVHAEQNALITAARFGNSIEEAVVYSTLRPCFDCTKAMLQAKVHTIYYIHDWQHPIGSLQDQYLLAQDKLPGGVRRIDIVDPEADWANGKTSA